MKKILVLTPRFPYPVIGGDRLRIYEICKELSRNYELTLVSLCDTNEELDMETPDDNIFSSIYRVYLPKWKSYINTLLAIPSNTPLQVAYYKSSEYSKLISSLCSQHDFILPHLIRVAGYVKNVDKPKVLEMTDAISMNYNRVSTVKGNNSGFKGLIYRIERKRLNKYEKHISKYFDHTVFVSQFDVDYLYPSDQKLKEKAVVCTNGVDLSKFPYDYNPVEKKLIFIGNLMSEQNFDAAYFFSSKVLPKLRLYGDYQFHIIGRISDEKRSKFKGFDGVFVTGSVDSIPDYSKGALAGICSVRLAAGVQNKILEYMALGIPTVSSSIGLEGLNAIDGESILIANTADEYVQKILSIENNKELALSISEKAYSYVKHEHSWASKLKPYFSIINNLLE